AVVAAIAGPPAASPPTSPLASTVASVTSVLGHVTVRPASGLPDASLGVAVSCTVPFTTMLAVAGVTSTVLTGIGATVIADVPLFPSAVAVTVTGPPAAFPVTRPLASPVASVGSALCLVPERPVAGL